MWAYPWDFRVKIIWNFWLWNLFFKKNNENNKMKFEQWINFVLSTMYLYILHGITSSFMLIDNSIKTTLKISKWFQWNEFEWIFQTDIKCCNKFSFRWINWCSVTELINYNSDELQFDWIVMKWIVTK